MHFNYGALAIKINSNFMNLLDGLFFFPINLRILFVYLTGQLGGQEKFCYKFTLYTKQSKDYHSIKA